MSSVVTVVRETMAAILGFAHTQKSIVQWLVFFWYKDVWDANIYGSLCTQCRERVFLQRSVCKEGRTSVSYDEGAGSKSVHDLWQLKLRKLANWFRCYCCLGIPGVSIGTLSGKMYNDQPSSFQYEAQWKADACNSYKTRVTATQGGRVDAWQSTSTHRW